MSTNSLYDCYINFCLGKHGKRNPYSTSRSVDGICVTVCYMSGGGVLAIDTLKQLSISDREHLSLCHFWLYFD